MLFENNRIDIYYRESQDLRNAARELKEEIQRNDRYLIEHKKEFWIRLIIYGHKKPLQREYSDNLLIDMLNMDDDVYDAFTEFIVHLVQSDAIVIMSNFLLSNGMGVHQLNLYR